MGRQLAVLALVTAGVIGSLAACSGADGPVTITTTAPFSGYYGLPTASGTPLVVEGEGATPPQDVLGGVQAWASGNTLTITTFGSRSCPAVPKITSIDEPAAQINVEIAAAGGDPCTADISARTFEIPTDSDLEGFTLEVTFLQK